MSDLQAYELHIEICISWPLRASYIVVYVGILAAGRMMNILSRLPKIYDVATSDQNWTKALDQFCDAGGVKGVSFFSSDNTDYGHTAQAMNDYYGNESRASVVADYFERFHDIDKKAVEFMYKQRPFKRIEDDEIWPGFMDLRTRPDLEFLERHMKVFRRAAYNISSSEGWSALVSLNYSLEIDRFNPAHVQEANLLALHLGKALEINRFYSKLRHKYSAVFSVLDHMEAAVCVALHSGEVVAKNRKAEEIFSENDGVIVDRENRLRLTNNTISEELKAAIGDCAETALGTHNSCQRIVFAKRKSDKLPYLLEVSPLRDGDDELNDNIIGAMVLIIDPEAPIALRSQPIQTLFELSNAETETLELLFQGRSEADIAEIRNVTLNTVKNQRKSVYFKVGVNSRAGLIRKSAAISPPVR